MTFIIPSGNEEGYGNKIVSRKTAVKAGGKVIGHLDDAVDIAKAADKAGDAAKAAGKARKAGNGSGELGKYVDEAVEGGTDVLDEIKRIDDVDAQIQKMAENMSEAEKNSTYLNVNLIYKGD